jgi:hypothetical protein
VDLFRRTEAAWREDSTRVAAVGSPSTGANGRVAGRRPLGAAPAILPTIYTNAAFSVVPSIVAPTMIATPTREAIRPYSMAVTPDSLRRKFRTILMGYSS